MIGEQAELFSPVPGPAHRDLRYGCPAASSGTEIDAAHDDAGRSAFELPRLEFAGPALLDPVPQPRELFLAPVCRRPRHVFQIIHRRSTDGAGYFPVVV